MLHINIASLSKQIDELRSLIKLLNHLFGIIRINETQLYEDTPLVSIDIDVSKNTLTNTKAVGRYIKSCQIYQSAPVEIKERA